MIILIQFIAVIFALTMIYFAYLYYQKKTLNKDEIYIWVAIWTLVILFALFPDIFRDFSNEVLLTRLFDLMVVGGFVLVITMTAKAYLSTRKTEKKVEEFIRSEALKSSSDVKQARGRARKK